MIRGNYRVAYDRINTFLASSAIFQSIPGITFQTTNTAFGQAGGRLRQASEPGADRHAGIVAAAARSVGEFDAGVRP